MYGAGGEPALQQCPSQRILDQSLQRPLERPRPELRVVPFAGDDRARGRCQLQGQVAIGQSLLKVGQQQVDDPVEVRVRQRVEHDDLVDTVQELGPEASSEAPR